MNKQIRDFAKISELDIYGLGKDREKFERCLEKFANLIISETCSIVKDEVQYEYGPGFADYINNTLKKHFGVL